MRRRSRRGFGGDGVVEECADGKEGAEEGARVKEVVTEKSKADE